VRTTEGNGDQPDSCPHGELVQTCDECKRDLQQGTSRHEPDRNQSRNGNSDPTR